MNPYQWLGRAVRQLGVSLCQDAVRGRLKGRAHARAVRFVGNDWGLDAENEGLGRPRGHRACRGNSHDSLGPAQGQLVQEQEAGSGLG